MMLARYVLHDNKTLRYIEYVLYLLEKTMIAFKNYWPIDLKLCWPTFNYLKFHAISHIVPCFWDYSNAVNYDIANSEVAYKYPLKAFSNRTNKKEYELQIWQHNISHINMIVMNNTIILEKIKAMRRHCGHNKASKIGPSIESNRFCLEI